MTKLQCSVNSCMNNQSGCCCLPNIQVGGDNAQNCVGTSCDSYVECTSGICNNTAPSCPNDSLDICCEACNCAHNDSHKCSADSASIQIGSDGTECSTFKKK